MAKLNLPTLNVGDRVTVRKSRPGVIMIIERTLQQYYVRLDNGRQAWVHRSEVEELLEEALDENEAQEVADEA